jgi:hypothetical protein
MKKLVFILAIALVLIGVMAAPAMADKPLLTFETALRTTWANVSGTLADGFSGDRWCAWSLPPAHLGRYYRGSGPER